MRIRLVGGTASRLAMALTHREDDLPDLIDLAPFNSDIDLEHTGPDQLSAEIFAAVEEVVPAAMWCRWTVVGEAEAAARAARLRQVSRVPLRTIAFDTGWPLTPSAEALHDLASGAVQIMAHPEYRQSDAFLAGQDLEVFGALIAMRAAADLQAFVERPAGVSDHDLRAFRLRFERNGDAERLKASNGLQARARELATPLFLRDAVATDEGHALLRVLEDGLSEPLVRGDDRAVAVLAASAVAYAPMKVELERMARVDGVEEDLRRRGYELDPVFEPVALTRPILLRARSKAPEVRRLGGERAFLHLSWFQPGERPSLTTAIAVPEVEGDDIEPSLAVGGLFPNGQSWLRMEVSDVLQFREEISVRVAVLGVAPHEEDEAGASRRRRNPDPDAEDDEVDDDWEDPFLDPELETVPLTAQEA